MIGPPVPSHTAADTPESLRSCLGRLGDRDAPWGAGGAGGYISSFHPHSCGCTRVPRVPPGPFGG